MLDSQYLNATFIAILSIYCLLMKNILTTPAVPLAFLSLFTLLLPQIAAGQSYTVHPWEFHQRRSPGHRINETTYDELYEYYYNSPQRSQTHGLHPFNRRRYYNPRPYVFVSDFGLLGSYLQTDVYELDERIGRWVHADAATESGPAIGVKCKNYSLVRPNYRVPPFGYRCGE
jgi:hypothetical protein